MSRVNLLSQKLRLARQRSRRIRAWATVVTLTALRTEAGTGRVVWVVEDENPWSIPVSLNIADEPQYVCGDADGTVGRGSRDHQRRTVSAGVEH